MNACTQPPLQTADRAPGGPPGSPMIAADAGRDVLIAVDGEINPDTAPLVMSAGSPVLIGGSSIHNREASWPRT